MHTRQPRGPPEDARAAGRDLPRPAGRGTQGYRRPGEQRLPPPLSGAGSPSSRLASSRGSPSSLGAMPASPSTTPEDPACRSPQAYVSARSLGSVNSEVVPGSSAAYFKAKALSLGRCRASFVTGHCGVVCGRERLSPPWTAVLRAGLPERAVCRPSQPSRRCLCSSRFLNFPCTPPPGSCLLACCKERDTKRPRVTQTPGLPC